MRCFPAAGLWAAAAVAFIAAGAFAAGPAPAATPALNPGATASGRAESRPGAPGEGASGSSLSLQVLTPIFPSPQADAVTSGSFDTRFQPIEISRARRRGGTFWLKLQLPAGATGPVSSAGGDGSAGSGGSESGAGPPIGAFAQGLPVIVAREGHDPRVQLYAPFDGVYSQMPRAARLPELGGGHEVVFILPRTLAAEQPLYARVAAPDDGVHSLRFTVSTLDSVLKRGAAHARMISLAFGALMALSLGSLLIWCVLSDKVFLFYTALFSLQGLYIVFLSGQGFEWPLLSFAVPLSAYAWNVPIALSGAAAAVFVREIADIRVFSPRAYTAFGWFAVAFIVLTFANLAKRFGYEDLVNALGNVLFLSSAVFTLWISFSAWRHGSRAAGWFLLAWVLLEAFNIATTIQLLLSDGETGDALLYSGLPLSMVAAAVLTALGVADRLRGQRIALTEAERRAQTDPLTGVLNRRSLVERLETACARARTRGLPIALLFIDLDHFKEINDTFGHQAGDACLAAIVGPIQAELRQSDVIGRYGGEEFVVILSSADAAAARPIAERILRGVASVRVQGFGETISLTCSIGIATSDMLGVWGQHLIARADAAVYIAKRAGRNRVQLAEPVAA